MFRNITRIAVINDRLCCTFKNVCKTLKTSCKVNSFNIRFTFGSRVCQRRRPHTVKLVDTVFFLNLSIFYDKTAQTRMSFHDAYNFLCRNQSAQSSPANIRSSTNRRSIFCKSSRIDSFCIRNFNNFTTPFLHNVINFVADFRKIICFPVITMNDKIRLKSFKVWHITPVFLRNNFTYSLKIFNNILTLFISKIRKTLVIYDSLVGQKTYDYISVFCPFINDVDDSRVNNITSKT